MSDEKTTVIKTGGGSGWFVAVLLIIVIAVAAGYIYSTGALDGSKDVNISVELPKAE